MKYFTLNTFLDIYLDRQIDNYIDIIKDTYDILHTQHIYAQMKRWIDRQINRWKIDILIDTYDILHTQHIYTQINRLIDRQID